MEQKKKEEEAIVLDFLPHGYPFEQKGYKKIPIIQAIGKENFTLLELVPRKDVFVQPYEEVYIGEGKRDKIHHISGRLNVEKLTGTARNELEFVVKEMVEKNEPKFVAFFNKATPLTTRMHQLELLPGVGNKHMWMVLDARKEKEFESFADIKARVKLIPDPMKAIIKRILLELKGTEKYNVFVSN
ncbi:DUF655 domain-containing protein [Nanoarchaeota archaeon]